MRSYLFLLILLALSLLTALLFLRFPYALPTSDDKVTLLQSLLICALVGSSILLHFRDRMGEALRYALYWVIIIAVLTLGYSYRHTLLNNALLSALIPSRPSISEDGKTVTFQASENGHFYMEAVINGVRIHAMLDTGASDIVLSAKDAKRIGIEAEKLHYDKVYHTANGLVKGASLTLSEFRVGPIVIQNMPASVNSAPMSHSLIGMAFLKRLSSFSVEGNKLTLVP